MREHSPSTRAYGMSRARAATQWLIGGAAALSMVLPWAVWRALPGRHAAAKTTTSSSISVQQDPGLLPPDQGPSAPQVQSAPPPVQQQQPVVSGGS